MATTVDILGITMSVTTLILILLPFAVINLILVITAVVNMARKPLPWNQKWGWLLLVLLVDMIGPIVYFAVGSNILEEKVAHNEDTQGRNV